MDNIQHTKEECLQALRHLVETMPNYRQIIWSKHNHQYNYLINFIENNIPNEVKDDKYNLKTKLFWILNEIKSWDDPRVKCRLCGRPMDFRNVINVINGYVIKSEYPICPDCKNKDPERNNKISSTQKKFSEKKKQSLIEKRKQTCLEKYGVDHNFKLPSCKEKSKQTSLQKYGTEYPSQSKEIRRKIEQTNLQKYGSKNVFSSEYGKKKIKQSMLDKYGEEIPIKVPEIKEKIFLKNVLVKRENSWNNCILNDPYSEPMFTKEFYIENYSKDFEFEFKCRKCGGIYKSTHNDGEHSRCKKCYPNTSSIAEKDIVEFIKGLNLNITIIENSRKIISPYELDIYIPEKKLAIEFDGLYWHSLRDEKDSNGKIFHLMKTKLCEEKGIHLIHIFDDEWRLQKGIVMSRLRNLLGSYDKKIYARKCQVKEVNPKISRQFQEENHIQGSVKSKVNIGLYYDNELISLMTFSKPRFNKKYEWELVRFCNKLNYHIPGAASKLLSYFEKTYKPRNIISYADRRWTMNNGNTVYDKLKFKLSYISNPNYWYCIHSHKMIRESRVKYQKHKLSKILEKYDPQKTEIQNMLDNGYMVIYDCGNLVYLKENY